LTLRKRARRRRRIKLLKKFELKQPSEEKQGWEKTEWVLLSLQKERGGLLIEKIDTHYIDRRLLNNSVYISSLFKPFYLFISLKLCMVLKLQIQPVICLVNTYIRSTYGLTSFCLMSFRLTSFCLRVVWSNFVRTLI
jgi:hypothetical protein